MIEKTNSLTMLTWNSIISIGENVVAINLILFHIFVLENC